MANRIKKLIPLTLFLAFAIPFILQINAFPFVQYGMYATQPSVTEEFFILKSENETIQQTDFPLPFSTLNYLLRKKYYQEDLPETLQNLHQLPAFRSSKKLEIYKITLTENLSDTVLVASRHFE